LAQYRTLAPCQHRDGEYQKTEYPCQITMEHFLPRAAGINLLAESQFRLRQLMCFVRHADQMSITTRPVGTAQSRVRQSYVGADHHHDERETSRKQHQFSIHTGYQT